VPNPILLDPTLYRFRSVNLQSRIATRRNVARCVTLIWMTPRPRTPAARYTHADAKAADALALRPARRLKMLMPTGILLTIAVLFPHFIGLLLTVTLAILSCDWRVCWLFFALQSGFALNDLRVACLTSSAGRWYIDCCRSPRPSISDRSLRIVT